MPPEVLKQLGEIGKQRKALCPQATEIASYWTLFQQGAICIWEAPSIDALTPALSQMAMLGMETEVVPVVDIDQGFAMFEEAMKKMGQ